MFRGRREPQVRSKTKKHGEQGLSVNAVSLTGFWCLQCGPEAASVFSSSPLEEDQDPHPGWSYCCYRPGDRWPHPIHHQDSVWRLHRLHHCTQAQHNNGLHKVSSTLPVTLKGKCTTCFSCLPVFCHIFICTVTMVNAHRRWISLVWSSQEQNCGCSRPAVQLFFFARESHSYHPWLKGRMPSKRMWLKHLLFIILNHAKLL